VAIATPISRNGIAVNEPRAWKQAQLRGQTLQTLQLSARSWNQAGIASKQAAFLLVLAPASASEQQARRSLVLQQALAQPRPASALASMPTLAITPQDSRPPWPELEPFARATDSRAT